jgi:hypothetical protein
MVLFMSPQLHVSPSRIIGFIIRVALITVVDLLVIKESRKFNLNEDYLLNLLRVQTISKLGKLADGRLLPAPVDVIGKELPKVATLAASFFPTH